MVIFLPSISSAKSQTIIKMTRFLHLKKIVSAELHTFTWAFVHGQLEGLSGNLARESVPTEKNKTEKILNKKNKKCALTDVKIYPKEAELLKCSTNKRKEKIDLWIWTELRSTSVLRMELRVWAKRGHPSPRGVLGAPCHWSGGRRDRLDSYSPSKTQNPEAINGGETLTHSIT